jgi:CRISP-associated protein Cas1
MPDRTLEVTERAGTIHVDTGRLVLRDGDCKEILAAVCDVAALALTSPRIAVTRGTLAAIVDQGGVVVISNERGQPVGITIPLAAHHLTAERCVAQAAMGPVLRKRAWQQIVGCKIRGQATAIEASGQVATALRTASHRVRTGDKTNLEARASQWYWRRVFGDRTFTRDRDALDQNRFLNYGYAILRSATIRAICASGLLPQLGLQHHNKYSGVPLADDLMEPFRPIVDRIVVEMVREGLALELLEPPLKKRLAGILTSRVLVRDEMRTVPDALGLLTASLAGYAAREITTLALPQY